MDETKKEPILSDEDFGKFLTDLVKTVAKPDVCAADQLEALLIALICVSIPAGISPDNLLMFVAKGILTSSGGLAKKGEKGAVKGTEGAADAGYDAMMKRLPKTDLKN